MVPVSDVARVVPEPNGSVAIVGTPKAGLAPAPPPLPEGVLPPSAVPGQTPGAVPGQTAGVVPGQQAVVPGQPDVVPAQPATAGQRARLAAGQQPGTSGAPVTGQRVQLAAQQSPAAATPRIARR
jgi:hypothetical protein